MNERGEQVLGLGSGFYDLDALTSGFQNGDLIILAGRPGMGKSMFVQNVAQYVAKELRIPVLLFSLETAVMFVSLRILAAESYVEFQKVKTGQLPEVAWPRLTIAASHMSELPMFIDDTPGISVLEIRAKASRLQTLHGIGLVIVDYLQLVTTTEKHQSREREVGYISGMLKSLAMSLNVPVIACSQLNRNPEGRPDKKPQLSDLRESGTIEQDADLVMFLYREKYYDKSSHNDTAELIIAKQRHGPQGVVNLRFDGAGMRFQNLRKGNGFNGSYKEREPGQEG